MADFPTISLQPDPRNPDQYRVVAEIESISHRVARQIRMVEDSQARDLLQIAHSAGAAGVPFDIFIDDFLRRLE